MGYDDINRLYRQYLGRDASEDEANNWISGAYGASDPAGIEAQISQSGEAQDYRRNTGGGDGGGGYTGPDIAGGGYTGGADGGGGPWNGGGGGGGPLVGIPGGNSWGAGTGSSPFGPWQGQYTAPGATPLPGAPVFTAPPYEKPPAFSYDEGHPAPGYTPPPAFSYADFKPPSYEEAASDPGYQFRTQQGQTALQTAAAARGTLADSGTLKALTDYGQNAASQEYQNVWNRDLGAYTTNRQGAVDTYNTNYRTQYQDPYTAALQQWQTGRGNALSAYQANYQTQYQDPYAASYKAAQDAFAPQLLQYQTQAQNVQHQNDLANTNSWNDYLLGWQDYEQRRQQGINFALGS